MCDVYIVIPVYNCERFLTTALDSVLSQSENIKKIILVDDGSTDDSALICDSMSDKYDSVCCIHQKNKGVAFARNTGIKRVFDICRGNEESSYIAFLDADDAWTPDFFNARVNRLMNNKYDLIGFQSCLCNHQLSRRSNPVNLKSGEYTGGKTSIWIYSTQQFGAMFYRVSLLKAYNLCFKLLKYSEDKIFSMSCLYLADNIYLDNSLLYLYRQNPASAVHNRMYGIPYFAPIIKGYANWDLEMAAWKNETRGELCEGKVLVRLYIMDMIEEHFRFGGDKKQLECFFKENPQYRNILTDAIGENVIENKARFFKLSIYVCKCRIVGILYKIVKKICCIGILQKLIERLKYPILL